MDEQSRTVQGAYEQASVGESAASDVPRETEGCQEEEHCAGVIRLFDKHEKLFAEVNASGISLPAGVWMPDPDVVVYDGRVFMRPDDFDDLASHEYAECDALFYTGAK